MLCTNPNKSKQFTILVFFLLFRFCTAGGDRKLRCFSVDSKHNSIVQIFEGHKSYINDCIFDPVQGNAIASVSGMCLFSNFSFQE